METVKITRKGISTEQAAAAIRLALGEDYQLDAIKASAIRLKKGIFVRAQIQMREEADGTVFEVRGKGLPIPLFIFTVKFFNDRGIARRIGEVLARSDAFT
jgi:hypothetical protein